MQISVACTLQSLVRRSPAQTPLEGQGCGLGHSGDRDKKQQLSGKYSCALNVWLPMSTSASFSHASFSKLWQRTRAALDPVFWKV